MTETAEPYYWIPPDPDDDPECACGGRCDCNDSAEDVSLAPAKSSPDDAQTSRGLTPGGRPDARQA